MRKTPSERLAEAIADMLTRIHHYCEKCSDSISEGLCIYSPKRAFSDPPTLEIREQIKKMAIEHFASQHVNGVLLQYFVPTLLPVSEEGQSALQPMLEDYQVVFQLTTFDARAARETMARALIFCPDAIEMGGWHEWFTNLEEAIRLTLIFHFGLEEMKNRGKVGVYFNQPWLPVFECFVRGYVEVDDTIALSQHERKLYKEGRKDWKHLYPKMENLAAPMTSLLTAYKESLKKARESRNPKLKALLEAFVALIEKEALTLASLPHDQEVILLRNLRDHRQNRGRKKYLAKRPVISLSDIECAQMMYLIIHRFCLSPKDNALFGEIVLFIWIVQHAAFSQLKLKIEEILELAVTDIDFEVFTIQFPSGEADITIGLANLLQAWIGHINRRNRRRLFPSLTYDNLEEYLAIISREFFGPDRKVQPSDFLHPVHVIEGMRLLEETRLQYSAQIKCIKNSPYTINTHKIQKLVRAAYAKKCP